MMYNLCLHDPPLTLIAYVPALSPFTGLPLAVFSEITKPGPTEPLSGIGSGTAHEAFMATLSGPHDVQPVPPRPAADVDRVRSRLEPLHWFAARSLQRDHEARAHGALERYRQRDGARGLYGDLVRAP